MVQEASKTGDLEVNSVGTEYRGWFLRFPREEKSSEESKQKVKSPRTT